MAIKPLNPHYSMENPATIYDEEALTALQLAARTTAKVNEVVESQNATVARVDDQDADIENQKTVVIPARIKTEVQRHIDNGDFDRQIDKYAGELRAELNDGVSHATAEFHADITQRVTPLEARLDTLLGSMSEGSTTLDAEVIDIRTNPDGTTSASAGAALRDHYAYNVPQTVDSSNYQTLLPSANIWKPSIYRLMFATGDTNIPADLPITVWDDGVATLITSCDHQLWDQNYYTTQIFITANGIFYRYAAHGYLEWHSLTQIPNSVESPMYEVDISNYEAICPSIDDINNASIMRFLFGGGTTEFPSGFPFSSWPSPYTMVTLITTAGHYATGKMYRTQTLITCDHIYYRYAGNDWEKWHCLTAQTGEKAYITVRSGGSILEGVKACYTNAVRKLVVEAGDYDIIADYKNHYGDDYFEKYVNYATDDPFDRGLWLENIEVVFAAGARVSCLYTGSNPNVKAYFSAFATGNNVIIDGLELNAENLRYGIHTDYTNGEDTVYTIFRNCILSHHKGVNNCKSIGAGFGPHNEWLIENCIFKSNFKEAVLSVHNSEWNDKVQSRLTVRNCYIDGEGYFAFTHHGDSPLKTRVIVTGCSYVNPPAVYQTNGDYNVENIELYAFCNEKRSV